jgi:DNA-directed RNA polymerase subunit omega
MARVTVEDCLAQGYTNYELVLKTAKRARDIAEGAQPLVEEDGDKPIVIALREIADNIQPEDVLDADMEAPEGMTMDQDQSLEPVEVSIS